MVAVGIIVTLDDDYSPIENPKPVEAAGGVPVIFPYTEEEQTMNRLLDLVGGLLLAGGKDVDPAYFNETPHPKVNKADPRRDAFELKMIRKALSRNMPVLGICRGIQSLNVAAGGTLIQDIPGMVQTEIKHTYVWKEVLKAGDSQDHHFIKIDPSTHLYKAVKEKSIVVNSYHHQAVRKLPEGFIVSATSSDGIIEGIESLNHSFVIATQCHIERLWESDPRWLDLYRAFVSASESYFRTIS
jgi:putative glutamine amidotransferase